MSLGPEPGPGGVNGNSPRGCTGATVLPCFLLTPTPMHPVLSCSELGTVQGLGAAQYRMPQGGQRSELAAEAPSTAGRWRAFTAASSRCSLIACHTHCCPQPHCTHALACHALSPAACLTCSKKAIHPSGVLTLPFPRKHRGNAFPETPRRMGLASIRTFEGFQVQGTVQF